MQTASTTRAKIVIVGGGFAGLRAARHLRHAHADVTLIDKSNHHLFQPLLYQVATAGLSPGEIAAPIRQVLRGQQNTEVLMMEVTGVDTARQQVKLANGTTRDYDFLVLATGARHSYFNHPEWAEFAPGLKSIADATEIRRTLLASYEEAELEPDPRRRAMLLTIVIVGAGPTGVELAGSIAELAHNALKSDFRNFRPQDTRVLLIEAGDRILPAFPAELAEKAERELTRLGVIVKTRTRVEDIRDRAVEIGGDWIEANTIMWAAGVKASPAAEWLGVKGDYAGRVPVNSFLQVADHPEIYVLGDTALAKDEYGQPYPGLAPVAMQQGNYIGKYLSKVVEGDKPIEPFRYFDKGSLATVGRAFAIAKVGKIKLSGFVAWLMWLFVHIMYLIDFRNRILVVTQWIWAYLTFNRGVRLIVEDEPSTTQQRVKEHVIAKNRHTLASDLAE